MNEDCTRGRIFKGDLATEQCEDEDVCQLLLLLERHNGLQVDEEDEIQESEWRVGAKKTKNQSASSMFGKK